MKQHAFHLLSQEHRSFPCIVTWVVFNEGWGQYDTERVVTYAKLLDSSRLVDPASGWVDAQVGPLVTASTLHNRNIVTAWC